MSEPATSANIPAGLPPGADLLRVAFTADRPANGTVLFEFPAPVNRLAVLVGDASAADTKPPATGELLILSVPTAGEEDAGLVHVVRAWADAAAPPDRPTQVVTLQGAQVVWAGGRAALLAPADRLADTRRALVEVAYYDAELHALERDLAGLWPDLEADTPLAFEFTERSFRGRRQLAERFRRVLSLRARLARITPHVLCPHVHPPTLANQLGERLRERARMAHRVEAVAGQIEVFERVYEACGQRASDFGLARTGHVLEWVIIVLLLTQTILFSVELLAGLRR